MPTKILMKLLFKALKQALKVLKILANRSDNTVDDKIVLALQDVIAMVEIVVT